MTAQPVIPGQAFAASGPACDPPVVTRFAPSPTGELHLGHAYSAILAHDRAREAGGRFLLRIEDIDGTRSRPAFVAGIERDLAWLGLAWDGPVVRQSGRLDVYAAALGRLGAMGLTYPCFCTRADILASTLAPHGAAPRYPGTCRSLPPATRDARIAAGVPHAWRLDMAAATARAGDLRWSDELLGTRVAQPMIQGDVVLARKDAPASYHLAVTVDDAAQGITHVVRGIDLLAATDVHRVLQALLGLPTPTYRHHALLRGPDGRRLAKRDGARSLDALRDAGLRGPEVAATLRQDEPIGEIRGTVPPL